ncbi:unnamed protein product [Cylindrotheca closterium]|uniref:Reverse transcriptase Ty1/copia-type domain-containing protein n=1 Tax=Cylindrotheca closterium TaxID=2856 RepID=A0AAD2FLL8_9STRA|nr:unnamed protein product [Cylindrotheca closterium]
MADTDAQVAAMTAALTQVGIQFLAQLQAQQTAAATAAAAAAPPRTAVYNLHDSGQPVDLSSRSGAAAADKASAKLPIEITGDKAEIVIWIQALKFHCSETYMDVAGPTGILYFGGKNLLTDYHSILMTDVVSQATLRTDPRAKQNSGWLFKCIQSSLSPALLLQLFGLNGSMPALGQGDGPTLFKAIMDTTASASLVVSMQALTDLGVLDPADFDFDIKKINAKAIESNSLMLGSRGYTRRSLILKKAQLHRDKTKEVIDLPSTDLFARNQNQQEVPLLAVPQFITQWDDEHTIGELTDDFNSTEDPKTIISPPRENQESEHASIQEPEIRRTRSGRHSKPNPRIFNDQMATANSAYLETFSPALDHEELQGHELLQADHSEEPHPFASIFALAGSADPDTLTFDEAMKAHDRAEFIKAMYKELGDHIGRKHWKVVPIRSIPTYSGKRAIPMVWAMKRKKNPLGEIIKWKARLCAGGHRSIENVDYWDTYAPVVSWSTVRLMVIFALINNWHMESIDFVLAYPQAPIKTDIFMQPPRVPPKFAIVHPSQSLWISQTPIGPNPPAQALVSSKGEVGLG